MWSLVQACRLYREHLLPFPRPCGSANSPSWSPTPSTRTAQGSVMKIGLSPQTASYPPPKPFGSCLDGGGDWITKAVKSRNGAHGKRLRALRGNFLCSLLWSENVSCTYVVPGDYSIRGDLLLNACHSPLERDLNGGGTMHSPVIMMLIPQRSDLLNQTLIKPFCKWWWFHPGWEVDQSGAEPWVLLNQNGFWG